jgi:hypothetical protein
MKKLLTSIIIGVSLLSLNACSSAEQATPDFDTSSKQTDETTANKTEKNKDIDILFSNFSEHFSADAIFQATAFQWKKGTTSHIMNGFRLKLSQSQITSTQIEKFFVEENFETNPDNNDQTDKEWSQGHKRDNIICLVQGRNGDTEKNTRDIIVNCSEEDSMI